MANYKITKSDGSVDYRQFGGTIQQFVQHHWSGRGVPDKVRVSEVVDIPAPRFDPIEPELHPVEEEPLKKVAPRKPSTRKKGD